MSHRFLLIVLLGLLVNFTGSACEPLAEKEKFKISYMGTVEAGHVFPWDRLFKETHGVVSLTTIHGVQIKPWLFAGAGVGALFLYHKDGLGIRLPVYIDGRLTLPREHFRPFLDVRFGFGGSGCSLFNPSVGYKYAWGKKGGVRLSIGLNVFLSKYTSSYNGVTAALGFDF